MTKPLNTEIVRMDAIAAPADCLHDWQGLPIGYQVGIPGSSGNELRPAGVTCLSSQLNCLQELLNVVLALLSDLSCVNVLECPQH